MVAAVGTGHVRDVPDRVCSGCVKDWSTAHGVGVAAYILLLVAGIVHVVADPLVVSLAPVCRVQGVGLAYGVEVFALPLPFCCDGVVGDGVGKSGAVDSDGRFQTNADFTCHLVGRDNHILSVALHRYRSVVGIGSDGNLWIDERVGLAVRALVAPFVGVVLPFNVDLALVNLWLERLHGLCLRHSGHGIDVGIGLLVVDYEQVAVAVLIGTIGGLTLTVAIVGMALEAAAAHVDRTESGEGVVGSVVVFLEERLANLEVQRQTGIFNCLGGLAVGVGRLDACGAEFSSGVVPLVGSAELCLRQTPV